mmetsp:Transcript_12187/g.20561  ORF Transcript_12187/g.20561 Transcript_12187/m.20561 type:complete len:281 (+) Transcript_12187:116-958(+)
MASCISNVTLLLLLASHAIAWKPGESLFWFYHVYSKDDSKKCLHYTKQVKTHSGYRELLMHGDDSVNGGEVRKVSYGTSYVAYQHGSNPKGVVTAEYTPKMDIFGGADQPQTMTRCIGSSTLERNYAGAKFFSFGCNFDHSSSPFFILGFKDLDSCREAFNCAPSGSCPERRYSAIKQNISRNSCFQETLGKYKGYYVEYMGCGDDSRSLKSAKISSIDQKDILKDDPRKDGYTTKSIIGISFAVVLAVTLIVGFGLALFAGIKPGFLTRKLSINWASTV